MRIKSIFLRIMLSEHRSNARDKNIKEIKKKDKGRDRNYRKKDKNSKKNEKKMLQVPAKRISRKNHLFLSRILTQ